MHSIFIAVNMLTPLVYVIVLSILLGVMQNKALMGFVESPISDSNDFKFFRHKAFFVMSSHFKCFDEFNFECFVINVELPDLTSFIHDVEWSFVVRKHLNLIWLELIERFYEFFIFLTELYLLKVNWHAFFLQKVNFILLILLSIGEED